MSGPNGSDIHLEIAGIRLRITPPPGEAAAITAYHRAFAVPAGSVDMQLDIADGASQVPGNWSAFDATEYMTTYAYNWGLYAEFHHPASQDFPFSALHVDVRDGHAVLYRHQMLWKGHIDRYVHSPILELIVGSILLYHRKGILIHGSGVMVGHSAIAFVGQPEAGKSTSARLWAASGLGRVMSDETLAVVRTEDGFQLFGTPFMGRARSRIREGARMTAGFLIEHAVGGANVIRPLRATEAFPRLFSELRLVRWDKLGMAFAMEFAANLTAEVFWAHLAFVPDQTAVQVVRDKLRDEGFEI